MGEPHPPVRTGRTPSPLPHAALRPAIRGSAAGGSGRGGRSGALRLGTSGERLEWRPVGGVFGGPATRVLRLHEPLSRRLSGAATRGASDGASRHSPRVPQTDGPGRPNPRQLSGVRPRSVRRAPPPGGGPLPAREDPFFHSGTSAARALPSHCSNDFVQAGG